MITLIWSASDIDPIPVEEVLDYAGPTTLVALDGWAGPSWVPTARLFAVDVRTCPLCGERSDSRFWNADCEAATT